MLALTAIVSVALATDVYSTHDMLIIDSPGFLATVTPDADRDVVDLFAKGDRTAGVRVDADSDGLTLTVVYDAGGRVPGWVASQSDGPQALAAAIADYGGQPAGTVSRLAWDAPAGGLRVSEGVGELEQAGVTYPDDPSNQVTKAELISLLYGSDFGERDYARGSVFRLGGQDGEDLYEPGGVFVPSAAMAGLE